MSVAVLPFNAGPNTRATLARQFANFAAEIVRARTGSEVHSVNYLVRIDESNPPRFANANPAESLSEPEFVKQLFGQAEANVAVDGLLVEENGNLKLTVRVFSRDDEKPLYEETFDFTEENVFPSMRKLVEEIAQRGGTPLPSEASTDEDLFGTTNSRAFVRFLEGYDALQYIDKTQGQVIPDFNPSFAYNALNEAISLDNDWEAPYATLLQLCRAAMNLRIGDPNDIEASLKKANETVNDDVRGPAVLAELYQSTSRFNEAIEVLEAALKIDDKEPALITRIGIAQQSLGMLANAEQNFRKAVEMEPDDKPSMGFLAQVISQQERAHEVPPLWRSIVDSNPSNSHAWANLGASLMQVQNTAEALRVFEEGLEKSEDKNVIKRFYAPALASLQEWDKAMDLYEDLLDENPTDVQTQIEYAQTLQGAGRSFEVPKVLRDVLGANPDPNTRAQVLAWLVELEQPKRVESVQQAEEKMQTEEFEAAVKILRPMRNWLADYWKMWALYAAALNRIGDHRDAEDAATRLINLFPGNEIGFVELANALAPQGKHEEQYNAMRYAITFMPQSLPIAINLGLAAARLGRKEEAQGLAAQIRQAIGENQELEPLLSEMEG